MQKKTNIHKITNKKALNKDKYTTFDGLEKNTYSESVNSPEISQDIDNICHNIVKHVQAVSSGNTLILAMDLVFKLDY